MNERSVLFLIASLVNPFPLNVAHGSFYKGFERRHDISRLILNVPGGEVVSVLRCGDLCARSSSCKTFCYSQSTALCHLSQPYDPIGQQHNGSDFECYQQTDCPMTKGYVWYGARCIKGYAEKKNYTDARAICTQVGGHLYHFKDLEWDLPPILDLVADDVALDGRLLLGADAQEVQGQYKWSDSSLLANDSPLWKSDQPTGGDGRCVVLMPSTFNFKLDDVLCGVLRRFVCQIDA